jgi:hypothetical protein
MVMQRMLAGFLLLLSVASSSLGQQVAATGRAIQDPHVAVAGTGDFMIVWSDFRAPHGYDVFARLFEASGKPKGPAFLVPEKSAGDQFLPRVAADEQGHFVVVWQGGLLPGRGGVVPGGDGDGPGVFAQRFDGTGKRVGSSFRLSRRVAGDQLTPNVAMASDGSFVAVWQDCTGAQRRCSELHVGRFTAGGERRGEDLEIPVLTATFFLGGPSPNPRPHVALEPDGFVVGWTEQEACYKFQYEKYPVVVHYTDSGQPVGERYRLDDGACDDGTGWLLTALTASRTGSSAAFFNGQRSSFQLFGPDGDPAGPRKAFTRRTSCCEAIGDAAMDSSGSFAIVWNQGPGSITGNRYSLQAELFDPLGRPSGRRIQVASSSEQFPPPSAAFAKDGDLIVVWSDGFNSGGTYRRLLFRKVRS